MIPADDPSKHMWWNVSARTCSSGASRSSLPRNIRSHERSNGRSASSFSHACKRSSRASGASPDQSSTVSRTSALGSSMTCTGRPFSTANLVRNASCRTASADTALSKASASSAPRRRIASGMLYVARPGVS